MSLRLAVVISHPIQYFVPWYRELAKLPGVELKVFYSCDWGVSEYVDPQFGMAFKWDIPMLDGYEHEFLPIAKRPENLSFREVDNPTVGEALARFNPDVVNVSGYGQRTTWRVAFWTRRAGKRLLMMSDSTTTLDAKGPKRALKEMIVRYYYRRVDGALYLSEKNRAYHLRYGLPEDRLFRGCLPIDVNRLRAQTPDLAGARKALRQRYGIPENAFVAMYCGKYVARKRPLDLVAAAQVAANQGLPVWALLVGEGPERGAIEDYCRANNVKNCVLTGFVNQAAISEYYAASDVLAMTSSQDFHPLIVSEGGVFGLPVVISEHIGCVGREGSAQPGVNALPYACGEVEKLTAALTELYQNRGLYEALSDGARRVADDHDVTVAARHLSQAARQLKEMKRR